ncbi:HDR141Cp [Eremothecium sinecaudum]|uniref:HDR141Cp n=1 Tax=Eremothecium sinecaudum TaxID=45286 RepID=A0A109UZV1_9SACH|nr:HDR141Cp [Eremothecium sinecaudum]AMD20883.1 HDR141Cp [Eremothecium sinecaudum]
MRVSMLLWGLIPMIMEALVVSGAVLGVDYGQQYGKAMVVSPRAPMEIVLTPESKRKEELGVGIKSFNGRLERLYGSAVTSSMVTRFPGNALMHLRSLLGKLADEDHTGYHKTHPGIKFSKTSRGSLAFVVEGQEFPVEEVVAMNLQQYVRRANSMLKEKGSDDYVDVLALTIPEYYQIEQRNALLDAVSLVPISRPFLISEGLSVAVDFALKQRSFTPGQQYYYLIYDMGASSAAASIVGIMQPNDTSEPLRVELLGYGHNEDVSGSVFTSAVADIISAKFLSSNPSVRSTDFERNPRAKAKILQAAEKAKLILSVNTESVVSIESLYDDVDFKTSLRRSELEEYLESSHQAIVDVIVRAFDHQFNEEKISLKQLDSVILTGGSTRVPLVQEKLAEFLGDIEIAKKVNADESAVNGVTIRGIQSSSAFKMKPLDIIDRSIYPYSMKVTKEEDWHEIFDVGSQYPSEVTISLPTDYNFLPFQLELYENHRLFKSVEVLPSQNKSKFTPSKCPAGVVYNVTFELSDNRLFDCKKVDAICLSEQPDETTNSSTSKIERTAKILTVAKYTHLIPLTSKDKIESSSKLEELNIKDQEYQQLQHELNNLEAILYDTRTYLEDETVLAKGPKKDISRLSELVTENLEWLDYESDEATLADVEEKSLRISTLKGKIQLYVASADEEFDHDTFAAISEESENLLNEVREFASVALKQVEDQKAEFEAVQLNVTKEYSNIKIPKGMKLTQKQKQDSIDSLELFVNIVNEMLDTDSIESKSREELFEIKLLGDNAKRELENVHNITKNAHVYCLRELQSIYNRRLRAILRQEEKRKAAASAAESSEGETTVSDANSEESAEDFEHDEL